MLKSFISASIFALLAGVSLSSFAGPTKSADPVVVAAAQQAAPININLADAETLTRELKGIGATKAKAIVAYREAHGPFTTVDELLEVKGIGAATLEKNRTKLGVN